MKAETMQEHEMHAEFIDVSKTTIENILVTWIIILLLLVLLRSALLKVYIGSEEGVFSQSRESGEKTRVRYIFCSGKLMN